MVEGSTNRNPMVADYSEWRARDYFQTYYSQVVLPDEQAVLAYQIEVLRAARARFGCGLEYGCGPAKLFFYQVQYKRKIRVGTSA